MKILFIILFYIFLTHQNFAFAQTATTSSQPLQPTNPDDHPIGGFINKVGEVVIRVEKIAERVSSRLEKMKTQGLKTAGFESRLKTIRRQIALMNTDWTRAQTQAAKTIGSTNSQRDYRSFRTQIVRVRNRLEIILEAEKSLIGEMKQFASISPSIKVMEGR